MYKIEIKSAHHDNYRNIYINDKNTYIFKFIYWLIYMYVSMHNGLSTSS